MSKKIDRSNKRLPHFYEGAIYADNKPFDTLEDAVKACPYDFDTKEGQEWVAGAYAKRSLQDYESYCDPTQLSEEQLHDIGGPNDDDDD